MNKENSLRVLNIFHKALLMGQIIFAAVCVYLVYSGKVKSFSINLDKPLQVAALLMAAAGVFAGNTHFKKKLLQIRDLQENAKQKFEAYRAASLLQWSLIEVPSIFSIICFFLTGNYAFIALAFLLIMIFAIQAPSKNKVAQQLQVNEADLEEL
ncbi:MAG: hypothetical protein R2765_09420 [Ferruginibacter sp.]|nr:hypothetical protein [Bacteroidota bacterium]MBX2918011.1 hypothetical protein [Ferruginibacter sp.]MCB0708727.1 hypothetical protein [Chitinophagaceae bacterium]MCC7377753.1 hypothetical protein [Chitinophagaceae bacterium]